MGWRKNLPQPLKFHTGAGRAMARQAFCLFGQVQVDWGLSPRGGESISRQAFQDFCAGDVFMKRAAASGQGQAAAI